jgi:rhomboid protease GluP
MSQDPQIPLPSLPSQPGAPALRGSSSSFPSLPTQLRRPVTFGEVLYAATPSAYVTKALIAANVLVYVLMVARGISPVRPTEQQMLAWGAGYGPLTTNGQPWRLFTEMFLHFGIIHIGMNMFVLWQGGALIERLFGNFSYLVIYLLSGLCGSFLSLYTHPFGVSAGASGAVFGVYGALFGYMAFQRRSVPGPVVKSLLINVGLFVVLNVAYGLKDKEIDMSAHLGGLISGAILGAILSRPLVRGAGQMRGAVVAVIGLVAATVAAAHLSPAVDYEDQFQKVTDSAAGAFDVYNQAQERYQKNQIDDEVLADILDSKVLPPIQKALQQLEGVEAAKLPPQIAREWQGEVAYLSARKEQFDLLTRAIHDQDPDEMNAANQAGTRADQLEPADSQPK